MAEVKFSELPNAGGITGPETLAFVQGGVSVQGDLNEIFSATNFQFTGGFLDTIQDIDTTAFPTFNSLTLNDVLFFDKSTPGSSPQITTIFEQLPTALPWGVFNITSFGLDSSAASREASQFFSFISDDTPASFSGGLGFNVTENGSFICYQEMDGATQTIIQERRLQNLSGYQSYSEQFSIAVSQVVDETIVGKTIISDSASPVELTLQFNDGLSENAEFEMLRGGTGDFTLTASVGVTLNGIPGGSFSLPQQNDRMVVRKFKTNEYIFSEYSGAVGTVTTQNVYDNSNPSALVTLAASKPAGYAVGTGEAGWTAPGMTNAQYNALTLPLNGELAWTFDDGRLTVNGGTPGSPIPEKVAYVSDIEAIEEDVVFGEMFFQGNATETVISVIDTPVIVNATYSAGSLQEFTFAAGRLTYTGPANRTMQVTVSLTASMNLVSADITPSIAKNGAVITKSQQTPSLTGVSPSFTSMSVSALVDFVTNDFVELFIENNSNTDNITVQDVSTFTVHTIGGSDSSADQVVTSWNGLTTPTDVTAGANIDITGGVISATDAATVVESWDGSTTPVDVTAGSGIDITGGVITNTVADGGLIKLGSSIVPTITYVSGVPALIWSSLSGTNTVAANTFDIGDTIEVTANGYLNSNIGGTGRFTFNFGGAFSTNGINVVATSGISSAPAELTFRITNVDGSNVLVSATGWARIQSSFTSIGAFFSPTPIPFNSAINNDIEIIWTITSLPGGEIDFVANTVNIVQYK
jgi:hypothetical protein